MQATGFYEFFRNEIINESAGPNLQKFVFNAPASQHRGIELGADWAPLPRTLPGGHLLLTSTYDDQIYTDYTELVTGGTAAVAFDRNGKSIPGVVPDLLDLRLLYDRPAGRFEGLGGFVEFTFRDGYWLDNANLLKAQGAGLFNVELHYDPPTRLGLLHRVHPYCEVENLANRTYVGSALNVTDSLIAAGAQGGASVLDGKSGRSSSAHRARCSAGSRSISSRAACSDRASMRSSFRAVPISVAASLWCGAATAQPPAPSQPFQL